MTTGGAISGYCAIGSVRIAARPASTRKIEITAAKIGRSMKKRENMGGLLAYFFGSADADFALARRRGGPGGFAPGGAGRRRRPARPPT